MPAIFTQFGRRPYEPVLADMRRLTDARDASSPDRVWALEHTPVYTLGLAGRMQHVHAPGAIPVVKSDRGGQVTYHGPGQLLVYTLFDLRRLDLTSRALVQRLEQAVIALLADLGLESGRRAGAPGVYVGEAKIAALGLRIRRGCAYHGLALNVDMDLEPFARIDPCGFPGLRVTQLADHGIALDCAGTAARLLPHLSANLDCGDIVAEAPPIHAPIPRAAMPEPLHVF